LDSDLKGYIESPGWYFAGNEPERSEALDNLLCTQGWSRFVWDKITTPETPVYPVESDFMITGKVTNDAGKPVQNIAVQLISKDNIPGTAMTDENGRFGFIGFNCPEGAEFVLQCSIKNNQKMILDKVDNRQVQTNIVPLFRNTGSNEALTVSYMEQAGRSLKTQNVKVNNLPEVIVSKDKMMQEKTIGIRSYHYDEKTLNRKTPIGRVLQSLPKPVIGPQSLFSKAPPVWYVVNDGMRMNFRTFLSMYGQMNAYQFESVDVLCAEDAITFYGLEFSSGAVIIKTKDNIGEVIQAQESNSSTQYYHPEGYCVRKEFYVPDYDKPEIREDLTHDFRTTIYWNPVIRTNEEGRAEVNFFTSDNAGSYSYVLEGIGDNKIAFTKK